MFEKKKDETKVDLSGLNEAASIPAKPIPVPTAALTPEVQSYMNATLAATLKDVFRELHAAQQANAMTPETLAFAFAEAERLRRLPTETEVAKMKRQEREKKALHEEQETNRKNLQLTQENCPHRYPNGSLAVAQVNNMPDRNPRFICFKCQLLIQPRHWECGQFPTEDNPKGIDSIVDGHPLYQSIAREYANTHQS